MVPKSDKGLKGRRADSTSEEERRRLRLLKQIPKPSPEVPIPPKVCEVWSVPPFLIKSEDPAPTKTRWFVVLLQEPEWIIKDYSKLVTVAPITTFPCPEKWDYSIEPGKHDHCSRLPKECSAIISLIQPVKKEDLDEYMGHLNNDAREKIIKGFLEMCGFLRIYEEKP